MNRPQAASIVRRTLFESDAIRIGSFVARPASDACGEIERQDLNAVVLLFAGVFAKHDSPGRHVVGTPSHAVFIRSDTPYRVGFPGAVGDRAIVLRFDDALVPEHVDCRRGSEPLGSQGLLSADAMIGRELLRRRLADPPTHQFEIETLALELLGLCLRALRAEAVSPPSAARLRRMHAVERVKEVVAAAPAETWNVARLAKIANLSPFHLCHVFRNLIGISIYDYVLRERLAQTLDPLLDSRDELTAIALAAGFASHSHFTARFRRLFGCTPSVLRRTASSRQVGEFRKIMTARASQPA
jgi:AraC-like DNA-binding protein